MTARHLAVIAAALVAAPSAGALEFVLDRVAAIVNDDLVTLSEVYQLGGATILERCPDPLDRPCVAETEGLILDALIRRMLMKQELVAIGMAISAEEIEQAIQGTVVDRDLPDRDALRRELEETGMSWDDFRTYLESELTMQRFRDAVLRYRVTLDDDELLDLYQRGVREIAAPDVVRMAAIGYALPRDATPEVLESGRAELEARVDAIRRGEATWADVAAAYDTARIGRLFEGQAFERRQLQPAIATAAFDHPPGTIGPVFLINNIAYAVLPLRIEKGQAEVPPFEAVRDQLADQLYAQKLDEAEEEWYLAARRRAAIKTLVGTAPP